MSYKKGYTYDNVSDFCKKYNCELLSTKEQIDLKPVDFDIKAACGHDNTTTFNKLFRYKKGIYCDDCFRDMDEVKCFGCENMFEPTFRSFVYCSVKCSHSREVSDEQKQKMKDTFCKKLDKNADFIGKKDIKISKKMNRHTYEFIRNSYKKEGCELLTTEEEFDKDSSRRIFNIKGKCGCIINNVNFNKFICVKSNINCKKCTNNNTFIHMKSKSKIDGISTSMITEKRGIDLIREKCKDKFIIKKMREGCKSDILVKPIDEQKDLWLPIQLKVTLKKYIKEGAKHYLFRMRKKQYNDMLVLFVCIEDNKFWLFEPNYEGIDLLQVVCIGTTKSKYDNMRVENLDKEFNCWYNKNLYNISFEKGNIPQHKNAQLEYEYVKLRENSIKFLNFGPNEMDGLVYDFKINNYKIQEKVCSPQGNAHYACIHKSGGHIRKENINKQTFVPYCVNDNDFYWFNIQDRNTFYVIPEEELIDRDYITTKKNKGKTTINITGDKNWMVEYKFYYDTINEEENKERLINLLNKLTYCNYL
jgi:hypothetical protein